MGREISNSDEVIDSRDVIARIEELESDLEAAHEGDGGEEKAGTFEDWLHAVASSDDRLAGDALELLTLRALASKGEASPDWRHGEALIRESYFKDYAQDLAEDIGAMRMATWPAYCIDWEWAARELKQDYMEVDFAGVTYLIRA